MYYVIEDVCGNNELVVAEFATHKEAKDYMRAHYMPDELSSGFVDIAKTSSEDEGMYTFEF